MHIALAGCREETHYEYRVEELEKRKREGYHDGENRTIQITFVNDQFVSCRLPDYYKTGKWRLEQWGELMEIGRLIHSLQQTHDEKVNGVARRSRKPLPLAAITNTLYGEYIHFSRDMSV